MDVVVGALVRERALSLPTGDPDGEELRPDDDWVGVRGVVPPQFLAVPLTRGGERSVMPSDALHASREDPPSGVTSHMC